MRRLELAWGGFFVVEWATQIVTAAVKAAKEGDWQAGAWLFERAYGKPEQRVEVETPGTLGRFKR